MPAPQSHSKSLANDYRARRAAILAARKHPHVCTGRYTCTVCNSEVNR